MELLVIGAADSTGRVVTAKALADGHKVTAYVTHPGSLVNTHDQLTIVRGDVTDSDSLLDAVTGKDAVVFAPDATSRRTTTLFSEGILNVLQAMAAKGVRRVITLSTARLEPTLGLPSAQRLYEVWILEKVMRNIYLDLARMEDELEFSDADWTVVRAVTSDQPTTGTCRVSPAGSGSARRVSRHDVADYILAHLGDWKTYQKKLLISSGGSKRGNAGS